jgi:NADH-quinone oxidoreductase subunit C
MSTSQALADCVKQVLGDKLSCITISHNNEVTIELSAQDLQTCCLQLREHSELKFEEVMDVCGVDYSDYGVSQWQTDTTTRTGFERGVDLSRQNKISTWEKPRFAVAYHLLSITHNHRLRIRTFAEGEPPSVPSVINIWESANWCEREAFDLFGIIFVGHPDLRRILTDYGFAGHPFRKDFPLIGTVEMRYDAAQKCIVYEPVSIPPRTLVPKVIRKDNRYNNIDKENS